METIYLDNAATTPLDQRVLNSMLPYLKENFGNANSAHHLGQKAKVIVEDAREQIAHLLNAEPSEIIFTSGGTESDNAAIKGALLAAGKKNEVVSSDIEHHAVLHPVEMSKMQQFKPIFAETNEKGVITASAVAECLTDQTALVSLMHVNNELGTINPVAEIASVCRERNIPFHSDMVQRIGKMPIDLHGMDLDFMSASAHKFHGPKGIGLLYIRNGSRWIHWLTGGSQERRRRGGTLNVPGVVGLAKALELAIGEMEVRTQHFKNLRKELLSHLDKDLTACDFSINGDPENGVPHILNLSFLNKDGRGIDGEMLLLNLDIEGICVSNGSACTSGAVEASHVLLGIGLSESTARSSIRVSIGKHTTSDEIRLFVTKLNEILTRMFQLV